MSKAPSRPSSSELAPAENEKDFCTKFGLYKEFIAEREEILRHKWLESEKAGHDIGFEKALLDWIVKYRSSWKEKRKDVSRSSFVALQSIPTPSAINGKSDSHRS